MTINDWNKTLWHCHCSFHTTSGYGFEAFFTEEDILVVAVCIKKEFHTIAVAHSPISDNEWVSRYDIIFFPLKTAPTVQLKRFTLIMVSRNR